MSRRWLRPAALTALHGLLVAVLSLTTNIVLFVLSLVSLALIPAFGIGFAHLPGGTAGVRLATGLHRRMARLARVADPAAVPAGATRRAVRHAGGASGG